MIRLQHYAAALCAVVLVAGCDKNPGGPTPILPVSIQVSGNPPPVGITSQFTATAIASDGRQSVITAQAAWLSSDPSIATVTPAGVVQGIAPGNAEISATYAGVKGVMTVAVGANPCAFAISPTDANLPGSGGQVTVNVNMTSGVSCAWSATVSSWLSIIGPATGTGSGSLVVSAPFNPTPARVGTVNLAGASVTINQAGGECVSTISPAMQDVPDQGGSFVLQVLAADSCSWSVSGGAAFITVGHQIRSGNADVIYQVDPNPSGNMRTATLTIDKFNIVITQSGPSSQQLR